MGGRAAPSRVLIADDNAIVRAMLFETLRSEADFDVVAVAEDAEQAVQLAHEHRPDVVLLDVTMPAGGGQHAAAAISSGLPEARLVALSAHEDQATVRSMLAAGVHAYAIKTSSTAELLSVLRWVVAQGPETAAPPQQPVEGRSPQPRVSLLVAHGDARLLHAMADALADDPQIELVGLAQTPAHAASLAARHQPLVALVDVELAFGGDTIATEVADASPGTCVVALSAKADRGEVLRMVRSGARGYVQSGGLEDLRAAVLGAARGHVALSHEAAEHIVDELVLRLEARDEDAALLTARRRIEQALDALRIAFQPICDLRTGRVVGFEALSRFDCAPLLGPDVWFAEAAAAGMCVEAELEAVRKGLARLPELPEDAWLSVNVSPIVAAEPLLLELVEPVCDRVVVEMTEHAPVEDYGELREALDRLRACGARLSVDDAGAGFASLRHILRLAPDFIKLDVSLCRGVGGDPAQRAMARALVGFAEETGSTVIAEGVESEADISALRDLAVPLGQGYELGRPGPPPRRERQAVRRKVR